MKTYSYKKVFQVVVVAILLLSGAVVGYVWIKREHQYQLETMQRIHEDHVALRKAEVRAIVEQLVDEIAFHQAEVEDRLKRNILEKVRVAIDIATAIHARESGARDEAEVRQLIIDALMPLRFFNGRGYYWIHDTDHILVAHPFREGSIGGDDTDLVDSQGQLLIQSFVSAALSDSRGGFVDYYWSKPEIDERYHRELGRKKIAYLQLFEPYNWVIGVGEYVEDVEAQTQEAMIRRIAAVRFGEAGYIFNHDRHGVCLNHINEEVIGRNRWELLDASGMKLVQELDRVGRQPGGGFLEYVATIDPRTGAPAKKLSFVRSVDGWGWVMGAGVYFEDIEARLAEVQASMQQRLIVNILIAGIALGITAMLVLVVSQRMAAWFSRELNLIVSRGESGENAPVDLDALRIAELREIGAKSNMVLAQNAKIQAQLLQAQKMESVGILAGGVAHDFNNLLHVMRGNIELLARNPSIDPQGAARLKSVTTSLDRAARLVQQLLLFSRKVESGKEPVDLNQEVREAAQMLERTIPKMIALELRLDPAVRPISGDPVQVEQVLLNLANNAVDAMPDGGRLIIETSNVDLDANFVGGHPGATVGRHVLLTVTDTGCGMDEATLKQAFDPFFTTKEVGQGTGLGLASVYGVVKSHGGLIHCYSEPGQGTTFRVYLPAADSFEAGLDEPLQPKASLKTNMDGVNDARTVLVVDDESTIRELTQEALEDFGYVVLHAANGEEALAIYQEHGQTIDLVLLDLNMPGMGGHKCLQELLRLDPAVRVLISSGYSANGQARESLKSGAVGFIGKPYQLKELEAAVRGALGKE
ncbi:cache domain-containing protein [Desulfonatronum thiodismutans]|uniref:cache domain-containing protein n=1 Tax=Desulfonatronum thiodismutans TaxID=159290 RepID=UPI00068F8DFA|nr:cache domain-containing protein [Desulfonatronum thiodismutans]